MTGLDSPLDDPGALDRDDPRVAWVGEYRGHTDGRNASLEIRRAPQDDLVNIWLRDLDRDTTFVAPGYRISTGEDAHRIDDLIFQEADGDGHKNVPALFLHSWDTNYLSGYSEWRGDHFGMHFEKTEQF